MKSKLCRKTTGRSLACLCALAAMAVLVAPGLIPGSGALAQANKPPVQLAPPTPPTGQSGDGAGILTYLLAILLAGAVIGVGFLPSKRGHQD